LTIFFGGAAEKTKNVGAPCASQGTKERKKRIEKRIKNRVEI
jgi:hypothetical protein